MTAPFPATAWEQLIASHVAAPHPLASAANPRVPTARCGDRQGMAKEPDDRYGSAGALGRAAACSCRGGPDTAVFPGAPTVTAPSRPRQHRLGHRIGLPPPGKPHSAISSRSPTTGSRSSSVSMALVGITAAVLQRSRNGYRTVDFEEKRCAGARRSPPQTVAVPTVYRTVAPPEPPTTKTVTKTK